MWVQALVWPAKPSSTDPMAQRSYVGIITQESREIIDFNSDDPIEGVARRIAARYASDLEQAILLEAKKLLNTK